LHKNLTKVRTNCRIYRVKTEGALDKDARCFWGKGPRASDGRSRRVHKPG